MHLFFLILIGYVVLFGQRNTYGPRTTLVMAACGLWVFVSFAMLLRGDQ